MHCKCAQTCVHIIFKRLVSSSSAALCTYAEAELHRATQASHADVQESEAAAPTGKQHPGGLSAILPAFQCPCAACGGPAPARRGTQQHLGMLTL